MVKILDGEIQYLNNENHLVHSDFDYVHGENRERIHRLLDEYLNNADKNSGFFYIANRNDLREEFSDA